MCSVSPVPVKCVEEERLKQKKIIKFLTCMTLEIYRIKAPNVKRKEVVAKSLKNMLYLITITIIMNKK